MTKNIQNLTPDHLFKDLSLLIEQSQKQVAVVANSALTILFWKVGKRIKDEILQNERAEYGKQIIATISSQLEAKYGRNFTEKNVRRIIKFFSVFPDFEILPPLVAKLSWSHFIELFPLKSTESRLFYAHQAIEGQWGKRDLRHQISRKS